MPQDPQPDWWVVSQTELPDAYGWSLRIAFKDRPAAEIFIPGAEPDLGQISMAARAYMAFGPVAPSPGAVGYRYR